MNQQKTGKFLKVLRTERGVTQAELAERLGVSNRSVSRWETGSTMPDLDLLIELAKYFQVEVGEILDGERKENKMEPKEEELVRKIADFSNEERNVVAKRMCLMFVVAIIGMLVYMVIDLLGLSEVSPYEEIISCALGFILGTLLTGVLYTSRYLSKIKAAKARLREKWRGN